MVEFRPIEGPSTNGVRGSLREEQNVDNSRGLKTKKTEIGDFGSYDGSDPEKL